MKVENVFKVAATYSRVRDFLISQGWDFQGKDEDDEEMDVFRNKKTGRRLLIEDISDGFPVTFLMGELDLSEFGQIAHRLAPGVGLLEVDSRWEGKPTTVVVAMTEEQVKVVFGKRVKMRQIAVHRTETSLK